ncbi:hypothetical protein GCM10011332_01260 [Terasakiella brassicae]|uniref:Uncharacterized protein n=1 Tax=Terasakiella brassicae TaxID=1634917 RepID=A0A917F655_9PROT|nr:hypothetical protein [Terasakiella brassicae]GGF51776.1 hypothetical protein GCM10011332_01260 [Terasakiella brassicae]
MSDQHDVHWLCRPTTIKKLWIVGIAILVLTVALELTIHPHPYFGIDGWFGFNAWFGFFSCAAMVLFAKLLGIFLKRKDTYYDD